MDTTILIGALFVLRSCVKCVSINFIFLVRQDCIGWTPGQLGKLFMNVLVSHKFRTQPGGKSFDVILCNPGFRLPRVLASYDLLVLHDVRSH
jgi:hypothetical protein